MPFTITEVNNTAIDKLVEEMVDCLESTTNNNVQVEIIKITLAEIEQIRKP